MPIKVVPSYTFTTLFASAVPPRVRSLSLVMPSLVLRPVSRLKLVTGGALGAVVSITRFIGALGVLSLPAASVLVVVKLCGPSAMGVVGVMLQLPLASTTALPITLPFSSYSLMVLPGVPPLPLKVGVLSLVRPSPWAPESLAGSRPKLGALGLVVSTVTVNGALSVPMLPAMSTTRAVMALEPSFSAVATCTVTLPAVMSAAASTATPITAPVESRSCTRSPATAPVPVSATSSLGSSLLVMLSVLLLPVSSAAIRSGVPGADCAVVSTVIVKSGDAAPVTLVCEVAFETSV